MKNIVTIDNLSVHFHTLEGIVPTVENLCLEIKEGEVLGLVGESGSGKSVTGLSIMGLLPKPHGFIASGSIQVDGIEITTLSEKQLEHIRGKQIGMIFQEPMTSLNPVFRIGDQISEVLMIHESLDKASCKERVIELLKLVKIPNAEKVYSVYPHQLSGGMRQRVMIAMALACEPKLIIADEPTTALDVTIQAEILDIMQSLVEEKGISILFITHDLSVIAQVSDRLAVMYAGQIVEIGESESVLRNPQHPYTKGLIQSRPENFDPQKGYVTIQGMVPSRFDSIKGCRFSPRCPNCKEICSTEAPQLVNLTDRSVRCHEAKEDIHG
ncbi:ABC transporter ATP-binding protein [Guggenheimella bovis]